MKQQKANGNVGDRETGRATILDKVMAIVILAAFSTHIYCYWYWLNGGEGLQVKGKQLYYISLYSALSILLFCVQILSKGFFLNLVSGLCLAGSNSLLLIEFMGKPEYWGVNELWVFLSTVGVSFLALIVLNEVKKNINDGINNLE